MSTPNFILFSISILLIPVFMAFCIIVTHSAFGQEVKAPDPVTPTPVPTPTPTSPNPNLQYLPQKAYVQAYAPENGIPSTSGQLQVVPTVVPQQQQQTSSFDSNTIMSILAMITSAGSGFLGKLGLDKAKQAQETGQENAAMNVKQGIIQQKTLEQVYENMPDKGVSINNKPEIQLTEVAKMKDTAVETATKS